MFRDELYVLLCGQFHPSSSAFISWVLLLLLLLSIPLIILYVSGEVGLLYHIVTLSGL